MRKLLKRVLVWLRDFEPAWLNSLKTAAFGLLVLLGVNLGANVETEINFWFGVATVVLTQVQAILTRFGVFAPATVRKIEQEASK